MGLPDRAGLHRPLVGLGRVMRGVWETGRLLFGAFMRARFWLVIRWLFSDAVAACVYRCVRVLVLGFVVCVLFLVGILFPWGMAAHAQASMVAVSGVVCGPSGVAGVTYVTVGAESAACGTDSAGDQLVLQVSTLSPDQPVDGGVEAGLQIGGAVLSVLAVAWCFRVVRNQLDSSGES